MNCATWKRLQLGQVLFLLFGVFLCTDELIITSRQGEALPEVHSEEDFGKSTTQVAEEATANEPLNATHELEPTNKTTHGVHVIENLDSSTDYMDEEYDDYNDSNIIVCFFPREQYYYSAYPADHFSIRDRRQGWVILYIIGVMYMFISLVIVCDEFFVPALRVITDKLSISDDVFGATFMAAARSAPRFIVFLVGVFITHGKMDTGTITGSAVFNILFVVGMCGLFSREVLHLTWWPLFRDVSFYLLSFFLLTMFLMDNVMMWWESTLLVVGYVLYAIFMKFNVQIEHAFKTQLHKLKPVKVSALEEPEKVKIQLGEDESCKNENDHMNKEKKEEEKEDKPLSLEWPDTRCKQATYLFLLPIVVPLWLTLPDVRNKKSRKFFVVTLLGSILWIVVFLYFMTWWTHQIGETFDILPLLIRILVVEMSTPDLITSVIVARKGLGDMAVSSSVGSNIFDITVSVPVLWLLFSFISGSDPVSVYGDVIFMGSILLVLTILFVIIIVSCKWKMNKIQGFIMLLLYVIFLLFIIFFIPVRDM